jgi:hypothetical protein
LGWLGLFFYVFCNYFKNNSVIIWTVIIFDVPLLSARTKKGLRD